MNPSKALRPWLHALCVAALGACTLAAAADYQVGDKLAAPAAKAGGAFAETAWEALVPKDWDPAKDFKSLDFGSLGDNDPRAKQALEALRRAWDNAPTVPAMEGRRIRIPGFVVPLDGNESALREFLLVPYFGACIHTPPPPANQVIHVTLSAPAKGLKMMDAVWVDGTLRAGASQTSMGTSGYRMAGERTEPYREK